MVNSVPCPGEDEKLPLEVEIGDRIIDLILTATE